MTLRRVLVGAAIACAAGASAKLVHTFTSGGFSTALASPTSQPLAGDSLYQLDSVWTTDTGKNVRLVELAGTYQVLAMMFTSCPSACPMLVKEIQRLERAMPRHVRARTKFVLVSIDPERDTPAALASYRQRMQLERERYTLLRGAEDDVRELSLTLGFSYGKAESTEIVHSKLVTVLGPGGKIIHQQPGVGEDADRVIKAIATDIAKPRPTAGHEG